MKITCDREKLLAAFQTVNAVVPARSPKPILECVKLDVADDRATLMATDLEVGIRLDLGDLEVEQPGQVLLPAARLGAVLRELSDETVQIAASESSTELRGERSRFEFPSADPHEYPEVAPFAEEAYHEVPARLLRELIRRTVFATDPESTRYALGGVLLEMDESTIVAVATDGRRLAKMEGPAQSVGGHATGDQATIVPAKAMQLIERSISDSDAEIRLSVGPNHLHVANPRLTIYSRLVEGRFPKWRDVFPVREDAVRIAVPVGPLLSCVRQAAIVTTNDSRGVDFNFTNGKLILRSQSSERGSSEIELPIAYEDRDISVMLDPRYVIDFLRALDPEQTFTLEVENSEAAAVFSTDDGYAYVIMPLAREAASAR